MPTQPEATARPYPRVLPCRSLYAFTTLLVVAVNQFLGMCHVMAETLGKAPCRPNVVFILADDLGIGNVGCYGSDRYRTPHLDRLASEGTRFTHCYTASLCGPSRALLMSGRYAFRNGATNQDACTNLDPREIVLPRLFRSAGYATACIGKWGQLPGEPGDHGFDEWLRFNGSGVYANIANDKPERYRENGADRTLDDAEYMPDVCQQRVLNFLRRHRSQPFFVYYSLSHVHGRLQPTPDGDPANTDLMADNIAYMDQLVGGVAAELDALGLGENTLVIFMGDNGTGKGQADRATIRGKALSGTKGTMLEGGGLVPMVARWTGRTPAGRVCDDLVDSTDLLTTFAELTGAALPNMTFDGRSFGAQLQGRAAKPRTWIFNQLARMWYVRDAAWKLNERGELYDMSGAPFVERLVVEDTSESAAARARLAAVLAQLNPAGGIVDQGDGTGRHANKKSTN